MTLLSKNKIKYIRSLELKKIRKEEKVFLAEGPKLVGDLLGHLSCSLLAATSSWLQEHTSVQADEIAEVTQDELSRASLLKTPQQVLAVFRQPEYILNTSILRNSLCLALDDVQDPGNLGTMVRTVEGAGVSGIIMNRTTVDIFNPKTVRSTMGSLYRVPFYITDDLPETIEYAKSKGVYLYAAHLKGKCSYDRPDYTGACGFMIGNEGNGLSDEIADMADTYIRIPMEGAVESLNAAISATLLMYECNRQRRLLGE